jgi:hypothetical protein
VAFKDSTDPSITGITTADDFTRANSKTFTWGCSETCTYRFSISASPFPPSGAYSSVSSFTDSINDGLYYINIQAKDQAGNESTVLSKRYLIDTTNPSIIGLVNDSVPAQSKTWNWSCSDAGGVGAGLCETRFLVDQNPTSSPSGSYSTTSTTTQNSGDGVWYLHIQTIDDVGNESPVYHYSAILDNTPPAQASINGMGSSPTIDTNNRTLTFSAPGDATHYQAVRARTSLGSASPPAGCNYSNFDTNPSGGFTGEVAIGTNFDFVVDEGYDNYFCWITRDTLGNWETTTRSVKLIANFPLGIILPMQGTCPTGWTEFTAGSGRILLGAGSGNNDADGTPLMIRTYASSGGLEETSGIPANTNLADTQVPATNLVYRSGNGYNLYADITLTDTLLDQQIPSDTNMPPYYVVRYCRKN